MNTEWLEKCAQAGEFLYGIYPYEVLMQMYRLKESGKVLKTELRAAINGSAALMLEYIQRRLLTFYEMGYHEAGYILPSIPQDGEAADFFAQAAKAGNPYAVLHVDPDEVEYLLKEQGDRPFYIPTAEEIETLCRDGYIHNESYERLDKLIWKHSGDSNLTRQVWIDFSTGIDFMDEINYFFANVGTDGKRRGSHTISGLTMEELNQAVGILQECYNSTNLRSNRGWAPKKLAEKMGGLRRPSTIVPVSTEAAKLFKQSEKELAAMGVQVDYESGFSNMTTIGQHGEIRKIKVGRNDPCPCGSGKKYKKCCGR